MPIRSSSSPDGRILYELGTGSTSASAPDTVTELNAFTGRILASRRQSFSGGTVGIVPVHAGVWVTSYESSVSLLSSDGLRPLALPTGALPADPPAGADIWRGFTAYNLGPFVLFQSYRGMTCDAPNTGVVQRGHCGPPNRRLTGYLSRWTATVSLPPSSRASPRARSSQSAYRLRVSADTLGAVEYKIATPEELVVLGREWQARAQDPGGVFIVLHGVVIGHR